MLRKVLHSKIHLASVTSSKLQYNGSLVVDPEILRAIGLRASDAVTIANCRNGARWETYIFVGEPGGRAVEVRGASAHLVEPGDRLIILHYAFMDDFEYSGHRPRVALMNEDNTIQQVMEYEPDTLGAEPDLPDMPF